MCIEDLTSTPFGRGDEFILDFGGHCVGYFSFHLGAIGENIDAPCRLRLTFGEMPYDVTEDLSSCNTWISTSWLPDEVINVDWLPTHVDMPRRYSFRYVSVQVIDTSQKYRCLFSNVRVRAVSAVQPTIYDAVPLLSVADPILQRVDKISRLTLRDCMQTVFEDGPRRDRRLWLGDFVAEALAGCGGENESVALLKEYWGGMAERGADTFWECFDPEDSRASPYGDCRNNSYCHAWSCTPAWLLRNVLKLVQ